jgi:hypothetical protein
MVLNVLYGNCWVNHGWLNLYGSIRNQDRGSVDWIDLLLWKKPLCRVPIAEKMSFGQVVVPPCHLQIPSRHLFPLDGLEQGFEIPSAKSREVVPLNDLDEDRRSVH